jgi:hypothetical protein
LMSLCQSGRRSGNVGRIEHIVPRKWLNRERRQYE